jgi:hypothetical protein
LSPHHPVKSLPLKREVKPSGVVVANATVLKINRNRAVFFIVFKV